MRFFSIILIALFLLVWMISKYLGSLSLQFYILEAWLSTVLCAEFIIFAAFLKNGLNFRYVEPKCGCFCDCSGVPR